jgi:hypothetical protein
VQNKFFFENDENLIFLRETIVRPAQRSLQKLPIEARTRILFAIRCHMFMASDVMQFVVLRDGGAQAAKSFVLRGFKGVAL